MRRLPPEKRARMRRDEDRDRELDGNERDAVAVIASGRRSIGRTTARKTAAAASSTRSATNRLLRRWRRRGLGHLADASDATAEARNTSTFEGKGAPVVAAAAGRGAEIGDESTEEKEGSGDARVS